MLHAHGDEVCEDDDGDEEIQVVAGAHGVDGSTQRGVVSVIWLLLGPCDSHTQKHKQTHTSMVIKMLLKKKENVDYEVTDEADAKWRTAVRVSVHVCVCVYGLKVPPQEFSPIHHTRTHTPWHLKVSLGRNPRCLLPDS